MGSRQDIVNIDKVKIVCAALALRSVSKRAIFESYIRALAVLLSFDAEGGHFEALGFVDNFVELVEVRAYVQRQFFCEGQRLSLPLLSRNRLYLFHLPQLRGGVWIASALRLVGQLGDLRELFGFLDVFSKPKIFGHWGLRF